MVTCPSPRDGGDFLTHPSDISDMDDAGETESGESDPADAVAFGTSGWRAPVAEMTDERVRAFAQGVANHLAAEGRAGDPVGVCYDVRESSPHIAREVSRVLAGAGHDVLYSERDRPTPLLAWAIHDRGLAGGVMVTASHNPPSYNGLKFFPADAAPPTPAVTDDVEARLEPAAPLSPADHGSVREVDLFDSYADHVRSFVGADLSGLTVVYDAMHGSGRDTTDVLLERAGAEVRRLRCDADPDFGGTNPEPRRETLGDLAEQVRMTDADIGVANDGDADRVAVVTPERGVLDANLLFAVVYDYLLETRSGPAVRTVSTTFLVDRVAESHGESVVEVPVGFKWVAEAMADHDALVGGEESGGFTVRGHVREKDGVLMGLLAAAVEADQPLDRRVDALTAAHGEIHQDKVSVDCPDDRKAAAIDALGDSIPDAVAGEPVEDVVTADGFKLLLADGSWLLVRPSGTEPVLRVYAEADSSDRVRALLDAGEDLVRTVV